MVIQLVNSILSLKKNLVLGSIYFLYIQEQLFQSMINGNFLYLAHHLFCRLNDIQYYYIHCQGLGGKKEYLYWVMARCGREKKRWARSQTVSNREEFETFTTYGLITRTNHANPNGYLETSEASKMLCGKHHTFSNAWVCAKGYVIYNGRVDRTWALVLQMCSIIYLHVSNISHIWVHVYPTHVFSWCYF